MRDLTTADITIRAVRTYFIFLPLSTAYAARVKVRLLSKDRCPNTSPGPLVRPWDDTMYSAPIVPHGYRADLPLPSDQVVVRRVDVVVEELFELIYIGSKYIEFVSLRG